MKIYPAFCNQKTLLVNFSNGFLNLLLTFSDKLQLIANFLFLSGVFLVWWGAVSVWALSADYLGSIHHYGVGMGAYSTQSSISYQMNRFRSDLTLDMGDHVSFHMIADFENYWASRSLANTYIESSNLVSDLFPVDIVYKLSSSDTHVMMLMLNRAYGTVRFSRGDLWVGFQRFSLGVGRLWRPTDVINSYNPINPVSSEYLGQVGVCYIHALSDLSQWQILGTSDKHRDLNYRGGRIQWHSKGTDLGLSLVAQDTVTMMGIDGTGAWLGHGMGTYGELAMIQTQGAQGSYSQLVLGIDTLLFPKLRMVMEGYYNGVGAIQKSDYVFEENVQQWRQLSRHYVGIILNYEWRPLVQVSWQSVFNLDDGSFTAGPQILWSVRENWDLTLGGVAMSGESESEFGYNPHQLYVSVGAYY